MLATSQSAHIRALADKGHNVIVVAEQGLSPERLSMGWSIPDFGMAKVIVAPDHQMISRMVTESPSDAIHVIGGYRGYTIGRKALKLCLKTSARAGLMSEPGDPRGLKGAARRLLSTQEWLMFGRKLNFVLATGQLGVDWFVSCSYKPERVFPYGYFAETPNLLQSKFLPDVASDRVELIYVGQCIPRKGIDILLRALQPVSEQDWRLTILGGGTDQRILQQMANKLGLVSQVRFLQYVPSNEVYHYLLQSDLMVLPSRFDGWGIVTNEALLCGVPVICSDRCGSSDLLRESWRGQVFASGSVDALAESLRGWIARGKRTAASVHKLRTWSNRIEGRSAADYMLAVFDHVYARGSRPTPPWYQPVSNQY